MTEIRIKARANELLLEVIVISVNPVSKRCRGKRVLCEEGEVSSSVPDGLRASGVVGDIFKLNDNMTCLRVSIRTSASLGAKRGGITWGGGRAAISIRSCMRRTLFASQPAKNPGRGLGEGSGRE